MKKTISNSEKSFTIFNKLIQNGFYSGYINPKRIELFRKGSANNYKIVANLNNENRFEVDFKYKYRYMKIAALFTIIFGFAFCTISFFNKKYIFSILFVFITTISYLNFKLKEKNELNYFWSRFLELSKLDFE